MKTLAMDFRSGFFAKTCPYHVGLRLEAPLASCTAPLRMKPKTPSSELSRDDCSTIRNDFSVVMGIAGCAGMPCDPRGRASDVPIEKPRHTRWNEGSGVTGPATHAPYVRRASAMRAQHRISTHVHTASELPSPPSPNDKTPPLRSVSPPQIFGKTKGRSFCFEIAKKKAKKQKWTFQGDTRLGRLFLLRVDKDGQPRGSLCPNSSFRGYARYAWYPRNTNLQVAKQSRVCTPRARRRKKRGKPRTQFWIRTTLLPFTSP